MDIDLGEVGCGGGERKYLVCVDGSTTEGIQWNRRQNRGAGRIRGNFSCSKQGRLTPSHAVTQCLERRIRARFTTRVSTVVNRAKRSC